MNLWRLWDGISDKDRKGGERARELLARVARLEPQSTKYYTGRRGYDQKEVQYIEWCRTAEPQRLPEGGPEGVGISMQFAESTLDGDLFTEVTWESSRYISQSASVRVTLEQEGTCHHIEGYRFLDKNLASRGYVDLTAGVNSHAVAHIRDWLEHRAHRVQSALEAFAAQRAIIESYERERQERERYAQAMRRKYLGTK
jgi:hypothetical protein